MKIIGAALGYMIAVFLFTVSFACGLWYGWNSIVLNVFSGYGIDLPEIGFGIMWTMLIFVNFIRPLVFKNQNKEFDINDTNGWLMLVSKTIINPFLYILVMIIFKNLFL